MTMMNKRKECHPMCSRMSACMYEGGGEHLGHQQQQRKETQVSSDKRLGGSAVQSLAPPAARPLAHEPVGLCRHVGRVPE